MQSEANLGLGFVFILLGALCTGTFAVPHKFVKNYNWENTWGAFFLLTMIVVPLFAAQFLVKGLLPTWQSVGFGYACVPVAYGFLWGCGCILFGIGISMIGLSLGYSIIMGLCALLGSLMPLFTQHANAIATPAGQTIIGGILICIVGVGVCGYAGILRERSQSSPSESKPEAPKMVNGLIVCILSGVFSACANLAFTYGIRIKEISENEFGNAPWISTIPLWILVFCGGFISSSAYSVYLLFKHASWRKYLEPGTSRNLWLILIMAVLQFGSLFCYGIGAHYLGKLGTSVGWIVSVSSSLIMANLMGFITAEWKAASRDSLRWIAAGLAAVIVGIVTVGLGNTLQR